jgi:predicted sulfurtransferase
VGLLPRVPDSFLLTERLKMKKTVLKLGLCALLATNLLILSEAVPGFKGLAFAADPPNVVKQAEAQKIKGKITNISQKAKTIALAKKDKSFFLLKFNDETKLKGVKSTKEFKAGEAIVVNYTTINGENIATSLQKALVKLPKGIKEIKTKELAELLTSKKDLVVVDARPAIKFAESHIPGAISIPYSKLLKMGDDGAKLLEKYKDRQLVFYCGGAT